MVKGINRGLRRLSAWGHQFQFFYEWRVMRRPPAWFDHYIDLHWKWGASRNPSSWERGIFSLLAMRPGCRVLDLCCGTGFFAYHFYSGRAGRIVSMDYSAAAIAQAKRNFRAPNLEFQQGDVRTQLPHEEFDNAVLNAALEYFTPHEADELVRQIKTRLTAGGVLSGNSIVARRDRTAHLEQRQQFFSREELANFLKRHFAHVVVLATTHPDGSQERTNLYFFASDGMLPFARPWPDLTVLSDHKTD
jgi:SAM-dependent methyltransferase